jgi:DNA replication protein DnaC
VSERIRGNLEEHGHDAMASSAPEYSRLVATGAKSFPEALLEMTDAQVAAVRERDLDRRNEKASFPYVKTLRDFDFSFQPSIPRGVVEDLATLGFLDRHENVVLVGSPGVGKTHIAVALGVEAIRARKLTYFTDCQRLVSDLARAADKGQLVCFVTDNRYGVCPSLLRDQRTILTVVGTARWLVFSLTPQGCLLLESPRAVPVTRGPAMT